MAGHLILAAGSHGNVSIPPIALLILAGVVYFIGRHHGRS